MSKENEIKASLALGTLSITDINVDSINVLKDNEPVLYTLADAFAYFWTKLWVIWDSDNDNWPFYENIYSYETFLETAELLKDLLGERGKGVEFAIKKWQSEYNYYKFKP